MSPSSEGEGVNVLQEERESHCPGNEAGQGDG